jgi:mannose-6-phosphate isomerase-like protein (cupin superfamily)
MRAFEVAHVMQQFQRSDSQYLEFLRVPDLSLGLYQLPAGATDAQLPHTEDEVYYLVAGKARIRIADEEREVQTGSVVYVPRNVEHRFYSIEQALTALVFFAPAEYTNALGADRQNPDSADKGARG